MKKIETYNAKIFDDIVIDILMNNENISEEKASERLQELYNSINIYDKICLTDEGDYSIREGIWNRLIELDYLPF